MAKYYPNRFQTVDETLCINLSTLHSWGFFQMYGYRWTLVWTGMDLRRTAECWINSDSSNPSMHLEYQVGDGFAGSKTLYCDLPLLRASCYYGGYRWLFICPQCHKKTLTLSRPLNSWYFACRTCYKLTYLSRQANYRNRFHLQRIQQYLAKTNSLRSQIKRLLYRKNITKNYAKYLKYSAYFN